MHYILILLSSVGLCYVLMYGSIIKKYRDYLTGKSGFLEEIFNCALCCGFWCSVFSALIAFIINPDIYLIFIPFSGAALSLLFDYIIANLDLPWSEGKVKNKKIKKK